MNNFLFGGLVIASLSIYSAGASTVPKAPDAICKTTTTNGVQTKTCVDVPVQRLQLKDYIDNPSVEPKLDESVFKITGTVEVYDRDLKYIGYVKDGKWYWNHRKLIREAGSE
ncbi:hypothetical protein HW132_33195 [Brasilonema sp. CT11]|nr:hypothetical protein [Brasilonema sp. CT11]